MDKIAPDTFCVLDKLSEQINSFRQGGNNSFFKQDGFD